MLFGPYRDLLRRQADKLCQLVDGSGSALNKEQRNQLKENIRREMQFIIDESVALEQDVLEAVGRAKCFADPNDTNAGLSQASDNPTHWDEER